MKTRSIILAVVAVCFLLVANAAFSQGSWTTLASAPVTQYSAAGGALDGKFYVVSGTDTTAVFVYDPATDSWSTRAPLPDVLAYATAGVINGQLYVAGGVYGGEPESLYVYNPMTDTWTAKAPMPIAMGGSSGGAIGTKLYVIGGNPPGNAVTTNVLQVYDSTTDTWAVKTPMPTARTTTAAGVIDGKLYVVGGLQTCCTSLRTLEVYDPVTDSWATKAPLPEGRNAPTAGVIDGILYIAGGVEETGTSTVNSLFAYNPATDTWLTMAPMLVPRVATAACVIDARWYVSGGGNDTGLHLASIEMFTPPLPNTPVGPNSVVDLGLSETGTVALTFSQVTAAGLTTVRRIDPASAGTLAVGFEPASPSLAFDISTWATYVAPITIALQLPNVDVTQLRILHRETCTDTNPDCINGFRLVDVTVFPANPSPETIYAQVNSLSPFVIARPIYHASVQPPINADGSSVFTVKRGVAPVKFVLSLGSDSVCNLPSATIALSRTAGGTVGSVNESTYIMPADQGSFFRVDSCQYVYNLNSAALGVGTYNVTINIGGQTVGSANFKLK